MKLPRASFAILQGDRVESIDASSDSGHESDADDEKLQERADVATLGNQALALHSLLRPYRRS
jgi:hypothetical protein